MKNEKFKKLSFGNALAEEIRKKIILHEYKPGQRLKEKDLCDEFGVSNTPIREAFRILQAQNLIEIIPYVGAEVVSFSHKNIQDLYGARRIIESSAAELAALNSTKEQINNLRMIVEEIKLLDCNNYEMTNEAEEKFHMYIVEISNNSELERILENLYKKTQILRTIVLSSNIGCNIFKQQHKLIGEAIINKDPLKAKKYMEKHFDTAIKYASEYFS